MINKTFISLIFKVNDPRILSNFRPITLCNKVYIIFFNILVNRIKTLLESFIGTPLKIYVKGGKFWMM